jgi:hypothetical protein
MASVDGKIVASGKTSVKAFKRDRKLFPDKLTKDIGILYIPKSKVLI